MQLYIDKEQLERVYHFNKNGFITLIDNYYEGQPHIRRKYKYSGSNIVLESFFYLDSLGNETDFLPEQKDYRYNQLNLLELIQTKKNGKVVEKEKTDYKKFEYDGSNRLVKSTWHSYFGESGPTIRSVSELNYEYINDSTFNELHVSNGELISTSINYLTTFNKPFNIKYDGAEILYEYTKTNQLRHYKISNESIFVDECPEQANYENFYEYDDNNLPTRVTHQYNTTVCEMVFRYIKKDI
ncbi:MAG: hypothetical protein OCD76_22995 [Reichenbachiella sp.]